MIEILLLLLLLSFCFSLAAIIIAFRGSIRIKELKRQIGSLQKGLTRRKGVGDQKEQVKVSSIQVIQKSPIPSTPSAFPEDQEQTAGDLKAEGFPPPLPGEEPAKQKPRLALRSGRHHMASHERRNERRKRESFFSGILSREFLTGARLLGWAGGFILLFGVLYFLRFAIDRDWITPTGRILLAGSFGVSLILGAVTRFFRRIALFGNIMAGLGFAILYGCLFFAFKQYHLVGMGPSFAGSVFLTACALFLSLRWGAEGIAILALLGGFSSPILLSEGKGNFFVLFSYIAALDLAFLFLSLSRPWRLVGPLSFVGTATLGFLWYSNQFDSFLLVPTLSFLAFFWLLFHVSNTIQIAKFGSSARFENHFLYITLSFGVWIALGELCWGHPLVMGWFFWGICLVQMGTLGLLKKLNRKEPLALSLLTAHALTFLFLGIASLFDARLEVLAWLLMTFSLGLAVIRRPSLVLLIFHLIAFGIGVIRVVDLHRFGAEDLIYHVWLWDAFGFVVVQGLLGYLQKRKWSQGSPLPSVLRVLRMGAFFDLCLAFLAANYFWSLHSSALVGTDWEPWRGAWLIGGFSLILGLALWLGLRIRARGFVVFLSIFSLLGLGLEGHLFMIQESSFFSPKPHFLFVNPNYLAWQIFPLMGLVAGWGVLRSRAEGGGNWLLLLGRVLLVGSFFFAIQIPSLELLRDDLSDGVIAGIRASFFSAVALIPVLSLYKKRELRWLWILGLSLGILYCFFAILTPFPQSKDALLFLNLPSLLCLVGLGLLLIAQGKLRREGAKIFPGLTVILNLFLLVFSTREALGWANNSEAVLPIFGRVGEQFGLGLASALWAIQGLTLLLFGLKGEVKVYRLAGMAIFGLVVLKVFIFDTSNLQPVFRILSFIASGALLLVGSFAYNRMLHQAGHKPYVSGQSPGRN
jgi:hypothetical protein